MNIFINHPSPFLTDSAPHGDGLQAFRYVDGLARRGHQVYIAAPLTGLREPLHPNIHLTLVKTCTAASTDPGRLHRLEYALRVRHLLQRLRRTVHVDVIHQLNPALAWVHLFLPLRRTPFVVGPIPRRWPEAASAGAPRSWRARARRVSRTLLRRELLGKATRVLIPIPCAREHLEKVEDLDSKIRILPFGVDATAFAPDPEASTDSQPHILFLSNLERRKGIYTLLEAFPLVVKALPNARLTIAGDGTERECVREAVARLAPTCTIRMIGTVPRAQVAHVLNSCTVFCLPSLGEPSSTVLLEAMACGKPVVVTDAGGMVDIVEPGAGLRVPANDAPALAAALVQLAGDPELCQRMGAANRSRILHEFDWTCVLERLEQIYRQAMEC